MSSAIYLIKYDFNLDSWYVHHIPSDSEMFDGTFKTFEGAVQHLRNYIKADKSAKYFNADGEQVIAP